MNSFFLRSQSTLRFILLVVCIIFFLSIGSFFHIDETAYKSLLTGTPLVFSGIIFILLYVGVTSFIWWGPKDFFRLTSAVIYGPYISTVLTYIAELINAAIFFNLSRRLGRGFVENGLKGRMRQLDRATADTSFWWIFLMRLFIVPFRLLDLGCGLTGISFKKYFLIVAFASPFRLFLFQYVLAMGVEMIRDPVQWAEHLIENPFILWFSLAYLIGTVIMVFLLKKKMG